MVTTERQTTPEGSILIWHTADWHYRGAQYGSTLRGEDFHTAVKTTLKREFESGNIPDIIVNGGDIYDNPRPTPKMFMQLMEINMLLMQYGVPMLSITGNHDKASPTWLDALFGANLEDPLKGGIIPMDDRVLNLLGVKFVGMEFKTRKDFQSSGVIDTGDILILHAPVQEFVGFPSPSNYTMADLPTGSFHAILLGDIHQNHYITTDDNCLVGYPGSTEMCSASEDTKKVISQFHIDVDSKKITRIEDVKVESRDFWAGDIKTETELAEAVLAVSKLKRPVVVFKFDKDVPGVLPRMHAASGDPVNTILRYNAIPKRQELNLVKTEHNNLNPVDFMTVVLGDGRPKYMYETCQDYIGQNPDSSLNLDVAVRARLVQLKSNTVEA